MISDKRFILYPLLLYPLLHFNFALKAYSQQISRSLRPSFVQSKGYRVSSTLTTGTSEEKQGDQLVTSHSAEAILLSPPVEAGSGDDVTFTVTPTSSLAEIRNINHEAFFQFGEGTFLNTLVETKENPEIKSSTSQASSSAFIIMDTNLSVYSAETLFSESY